MPPILPFMRRPSALVRNRPVLRSPVMARLDELFEDPGRNAAIYERGIADAPKVLDPEYVRSLFAQHSPDDRSAVGVPAEAVITHVFEHILGPNSWWGRSGARWRGTELLAAAYLDAFRRARALGNVPIKTLHHLGSTDGQLQVVVVELGSVVAVQLHTPGLPKGHDRFKLANPNPVFTQAIDDNMPEVSAYTHETLASR